MAEQIIRDFRLQDNTASKELADIINKLGRDCSELETFAINNQTNIETLTARITALETADSTYNPFAYGKVECDGVGGATMNGLGATAAVSGTKVAITFDTAQPDNNYTVIVGSVGASGDDLFTVDVSPSASATGFTVAGVDNQLTASSSHTHPAIDASTSTAFRFYFAAFPSQGTT